MDYTVITDAIDWAAVLTGVGVIGLALAGLAVAKRGVRTLLGMIGR